VREAKRAEIDFFIFSYQVGSIYSEPSKLHRKIRIDDTGYFCYYLPGGDIMTIQQIKHLEQSERGFLALSEEELWQAIEKRDASFNGLFWYGVLTTGIYCRPSCQSRQPKRENVAFFALPDAARRTGLRLPAVPS
jgi:hypothetical protein